MPNTAIDACCTTGGRSCYTGDYDHRPYVRFFWFGSAKVSKKPKFFYNSYKNEFPDAEINESAFTYPGPNPFTKETAILMMADSVEAASRSLKEYTAESIARLVNNIIDGQIADGLMKDAPISFQDVEKIKQTFIEKLKTMYHTRISYPELKKEGDTEAEKSEEKAK